MATTTKGFRYPVGGDNNNTSGDLQNLAQDLDDSLGPFTSAQIAAFTAAQKWIGRHVYNSTTKTFQWWDGTTWQISGAALIGEIKEWPVPFATAPPVGWLDTDQDVNRTTYAALFALYGTTHGAGDGSTTFGLPRKNQRVSRGTINGGTAVAATGGADTVSIAEANLPIHAHTMNHDHPSATTGAQSVTHTHPITDPGHTHPPAAGSNVFITQSTAGGPHSIDINAGTGNTVQGPGATGSATTGITTGGASANHDHPFDVPNFNGSTGNIGSGTALDVQPKAVFTRYIVKY